MWHRLTYGRTINGSRRPSWSKSLGRSSMSDELSDDAHYIEQQRQLNFQHRRNTQTQDYYRAVNPLTDTTTSWPRMPLSTASFNTLAEPEYFMLCMYMGRRTGQTRLLAASRNIPGEPDSSIISPDISGHDNRGNETCFFFLSIRKLGPSLK